MAANPKETTAIIRENAADHALRPLFMRFEWTRWWMHNSCLGHTTVEFRALENYLHILSRSISDHHLRCCPHCPKPYTYSIVDTVPTADEMVAVNTGLQNSVSDISHSTRYELLHKETKKMFMRNQRRRSAVQLLHS